jgi:hypothetical protein
MKRKRIGLLACSPPSVLKGHRGGIAQTKKASRNRHTSTKRFNAIPVLYGMLYERWRRKCLCWEMGITRFNTNLPASFYANTEADARAKILIYLLENGLCTLELPKGV